MPHRGQSSMGTQTDSYFLLRHKARGQIPAPAIGKTIGRPSTLGGAGQTVIHSPLLIDNQSERVSGFPVSCGGTFRTWAVPINVNLGKVPCEGFGNGWRGV